MARLRRHYDVQFTKQNSEKGIPYFFNLGISGDTSADVRNRFEAETKARVWPDTELAFIFCVGTNNARSINGKLISSPEQYREDIERLVGKAREYSSRIMMVGIPCCIEQQTTPVSWDSTTSYTNDDIKAIDHETATLCKQESIPYIPTFKVFTEQLQRGGQLFADGLHPNSDGHQLMFELMLPEFEKLLS